MGDGERRMGRAEWVVGNGQMNHNYPGVLRTAGPSLTPTLLSHCPKGLAEPLGMYANIYY